MTKEERKEYGKAYYESNKEETKAKAKASYHENIDKERARSAAYYQANKEAKSIRNKAYRETRKENIRAWNSANKDKFKGYRDAKKLSYHIVYCIPNYNGKDNYCGVTNQPENRMYNHKSIGKLNTSKWYELGRCSDRKEALALERAFHKLGYHGDTNRLRKLA